MRSPFPATLPPTSGNGDCNKRSQLGYLGERSGGDEPGASEFNQTLNARKSKKLSGWPGTTNLTWVANVKMVRVL